MTNVRVIELPSYEARVETGPVQFGDDWPGVFIRGDNALAYALYLEIVLAAAATTRTDPDAISLAAVRGLLSDLRSCWAGRSSVTGESL